MTCTLVARMTKEEQLLAALEPLSPERIEVSARGSGLNAVWLVNAEGGKRILKTYHLRRSPLRTALACLAHALGGRTSYSARSRRDTERRNLLLWRDKGFAVPDVLDLRLLEDPGLPWLCIEHVSGTVLLAYLAAPAVPQERKDSVLSSFAVEWARRHKAAVDSNEPRLVQEHGTFEHVLMDGDRFVTIDLEVSYRTGTRVMDLIVFEVCAYIRSLFRKLPEPQAEHLLRVILASYPERAFFAAVYPTLFTSSGPIRRTVLALDRRLLRDDAKVHKYEVARRVREAIEQTRRTTPAAKPGS